MPLQLRRMRLSDVEIETLRKYIAKEFPPLGVAIGPPSPSLPDRVAEQDQIIRAIITEANLRYDIPEITQSRIMGQSISSYGLSGPPDPERTGSISPGPARLGKFGSAVLGGAEGAIGGLTGGAISPANILGHGLEVAQNLGLTESTAKGVDTSEFTPNILPLVQTVFEGITGQEVNPAEILGGFVGGAKGLPAKIVPKVLNRLARSTTGRRRKKLYRAAIEGLHDSRVIQALNDSGSSFLTNAVGQLARGDDISVEDAAVLALTVALGGRMAAKRDFLPTDPAYKRTKTLFPRGGAKSPEAPERFPGTSSKAGNFQIPTPQDLAESVKEAQDLIKKGPPRQLTAGSGSKSRQPGSSRVPPKPKKGPKYRSREEEIFARGAASQARKSDINWVVGDFEDAGSMRKFMSSNTIDDLKNKARRMGITNEEINKRQTKWGVAALIRDEIEFLGLKRTYTPPAELDRVFVKGPRKMKGPEIVPMKEFKKRYKQPKPTKPKKPKKPEKPEGLTKADLREIKKIEFREGGGK